MSNLPSAKLQARITIVQRNFPNHAMYWSRTGKAGREGCGGLWADAGCAEAGCQRLRRNFAKEGEDRTGTLSAGEACGVLA